MSTTPMNAKVIEAQIIKIAFTLERIADALEEANKLKAKESSDS